MDIVVYIIFENIVYVARVCEYRGCRINVWLGPFLARLHCAQFITGNKTKPNSTLFSVSHSTPFMICESNKLGCDQISKTATYFLFIFQNIIYFMYHRIFTHTHTHTHKCCSVQLPYIAWYVRHTMAKMGDGVGPTLSALRRCHRFNQKTEHTHIQYIYTHTTHTQLQPATFNCTLKRDRITHIFEIVPFIFAYYYFM
jgi:hypothetical protein